MQDEICAGVIYAIVPLQKRKLMWNLFYVNKRTS